MAYQQTFVSDTSKNKVEIQEQIDMSKVDAIVSRIKEKYEKQGLLGNSETYNLKELRSLISEGKRAKIEVLKPADLSYSFNPVVRNIGTIYTKFSKFFGFIAKKILGKLPESKVLAYELYSADINYSKNLFYLNLKLSFAYIPYGHRMTRRALLPAKMILLICLLRPQFHIKASRYIVGRPSAKNFLLQVQII